MLLIYISLDTRDHELFSLYVIYQFTPILFSSINVVFCLWTLYIVRISVLFM